LRQSLNVWGKTLAATGGTLAFLLSLFPWGLSGQRTFQETTLALALNLVSLAPIIGTLIPRTDSHVQGMIILGFGGLFVSVWIGYVYLITGGYLFLPLSIVLSFATMICVGGLLVFFSKHFSNQLSNALLREV